MRANSKRYPLNATKRILSLKELTDRSVKVHADSVAFQTMLTKTTFESITYREFGEQLCALANALIDRSLRGKRVVLVGENSYKWVLAYFAVVNSGAVVIPLDKELPEDKMAAFAERADAAAFIHSKNFEPEAALAAKNIDGLLTISMDKNTESETSLCALLAHGRALVADGEDKYTDYCPSVEKVCSILFTSGTTGASKGVMLSHKNLAANVVSACELVLFSDQDVLLSVLPISHSYEDVCGLFGPMYYGACIAFCSELKRLPDCLVLFRPTVMCLVPLYVETFTKRIWESARKQGKETKLKIGVALGNFFAGIGINVRDKLLHDVRAFFGGRLKLCTCGGAYLNPELVGAFADFGITIVQGYGITECSPIISANRNKHIKAKSVGWVASCNEVKIDADGQILVRGDNVMIGYLDDPKATADAFDGEWFKTGDLGYMDKDGYLYVTGRCKNLIVLKNGKNIMPDEIEYMLAKSPLIAEAMVKETLSDANGSDAIMAIIYPDPAARKEMNTKMLCDAIQAEVDAVNAKMAAYKRIRQFVLRESEFPKTTTRKIQRYKVGTKDEHV